MSVVVENLRVELASTGEPLVSEVSFSIEPGKVLGLVGESGSGKTTVSLAMLGYARSGTQIADGSKVEIDGIDFLALSAAERRARRSDLVAYVPQDPNASLNPALSIGEQLLEGLLHGRKAISRKQALERASAILTDVGLPATREFLKRYPSQISGGQQQRIGIAMAIAAYPRLIVLDEPTTGLDVSVQKDVISLVARLCAEYSIAAVYVSHDLALISHVADQVLVLYGGRVMEKASSSALFDKPAHPYTEALLDALPSAKQRRTLRAIGNGTSTGIVRSTPECIFRTRCDIATDACLMNPDLVPFANTDHVVRCHFPGEQSKERGLLIAPGRAEVDQRKPIFEVSGFNASYGDHTVLHDIDISVRGGQCLAIVGESGSGKSTLSRCIAGLHDGWHGNVFFNGKALRPGHSGRTAEDRRRIQYIFQNPYGSLNPRRTIGSSIELVHRHFFGGDTAAARRAIKEVLERVALPSTYADRFPNELSGGEKQRAAIARALICGPEILVCDEVTSALDVSVQAAVVELLRNLMSDGLSMIFVTHNLGVVRSLADQVAVLSAGRIIEFGSTDEVMDQPATDYTRKLLSDTLEVVKAA
ncbi:MULTISPECIES: ABC transporter ATP-binding protein [unclassified Rhizobium]|uniref:ABC transporter ATP-binding protein n=1 Tax=unclassified Rhizobium TaxID=2613769 RepID=UPI001ADCA768|nr:MULTISPECIES: ABC transporter ATP-binding protein [unclassified Rhizobium]MBO9123742.1 ABC transporter ATP-binding protein [Rhizobium sp. 16-488-2b]MBO9174274.1 ABC transporter ATP-binding protein [Rhizobium sp. 16-488-2a]